MCDQIQIILSENIKPYSPYQNCISARDRLEHCDLQTSIHQLYVKERSDQSEYFCVSPSVQCGPLLLVSDCTAGGNQKHRLFNSLIPRCKCQKHYLGTRTYEKLTLNMEDMVYHYRYHIYRNTP